ncbi:Lipid A export ATP-binding/permease protein MsbA [Klebsiella pneumoniae]|uniref:Lipid A export ATP-binding/permease protein MsbA n=1 Tax=Klebsiella pneumoniae TaxID=573 RepID=A0ABD7UCN8_KLEPN|nr:Lipid A export ATP-binding/permease protein MsbA [Klebsiella pneumoniae]
MIALMRPLKSLTNVNAQFQRGMAACQTLFAILDSEQEKTKVRGSLSGRKAISSSRTSPLPTGREVAALRNINLDIPEGKPWRWWGAQGRVNRPLPA